MTTSVAHKIPMEVVSKILLMRPTHPTALIIKAMWDDIRKDLHDEWLYDYAGNWCGCVGEFYDDCEWVPDVMSDEDNKLIADINDDIVEGGVSSCAMWRLECSTMITGKYGLNPLPTYGRGGL